MKHQAALTDLPSDVATLVRGCKAFSKNESRDALYRIALRLVGDAQENPSELADALSVLLLTWNNAAYRYGAPDFFRVEQFLVAEKLPLASYRSRTIDTYSPATEANEVEEFFTKALRALAANGKFSAVGAAKALHLLAPAFFPLWDREIAKGLDCRLQHSSQYAAQYIRFMHLMKVTCQRLEGEHDATRKPTGKSLTDTLSELAGRQKTMLKFLDEYYYAKFTKHWIV